MVQRGVAWYTASLCGAVSRDVEQRSCVRGSVVHNLVWVYDSALLKLMCEGPGTGTNLVVLVAVTVGTTSRANWHRLTLVAGAFRPSASG